MKRTELFRLVWLNLSQNKFKVILTSIGIVVGAATIMLVIAIGTGGKMEVAEQFKNLNAASVSITCQGGTSTQMQGFSMAMPMGGGKGGGRPSAAAGGAMPSVGMQEGEMAGAQMGSMKSVFVTLSKEDVEELGYFIPSITEATIFYSTKSEVDGGILEEAVSYDLAGVKANYQEVSNLTMAIGEFLTEENEEQKEKVCVLGYQTALAIFGSAYGAYGESIYIDGRPYVVNGVLEEMGTLTSGISPDGTVFLPYSTGMKYLTGNDISPTITVIAEDVELVEGVMEEAMAYLAQVYPDSQFEIADAGSKMEAALRSNDTLQILLIAMSFIVFAVGGIGIMNVLFVSVKERTNEIGILKAIGCRQEDILSEFLLEAGGISLIGGVLGIGVGFALTPLIQSFSVRVELSLGAAALALVFAILTGTVFGFYPAYKASRLIPVVALNQE